MFICLFALSYLTFFFALSFFSCHSLCLPEQPVFVISGCWEQSTSFRKEKRGRGEKSSLEKSLCLNGVLEENRVPTSPTLFSKDSSERNQGSPHKTSTSVRFNQRPLIYLTSLLLLRWGLCCLSLRFNSHTFFHLSVQRSLRAVPSVIHSLCGSD